MSKWILESEWDYDISDIIKSVESKILEQTSFEYLDDEDFAVVKEAVENELDSVVEYFLAENYADNVQDFARDMYSWLDYNIAPLTNQQDFDSNQDAIKYEIIAQIKDNELYSGYIHDFITSDLVINDFTQIYLNMRGNLPQIISEVESINTDEIVALRQKYETRERRQNDEMATNQILDFNADEILSVRDNLTALFEPKIIKAIENHCEWSHFECEYLSPLERETYEQSALDFGLQEKLKDMDFKKAENKEVVKDFFNQTMPRLLSAYKQAVSELQNSDDFKLNSTRSFADLDNPLASIDEKKFTQIGLKTLGLDSQKPSKRQRV